MFTTDTPKYVRRWSAIALAFLCLLSAFTLPFTQKQKVQAQGVGLCANNPSFEGTVFALTTNNTLINFNPSAPGIINSSRFISGLAAGESIVAIDFRPATGQLFGVSDGSRLYVINLATGVATQVGTTAFSPAVSGTVVGLDFNPSVDRIRLVTNTGQNLRLNPNTGAVAATDTNVSFATGDTNVTATPNLTSVAYTNNAPGVTSTTLYGIDPTLDALVLQGSLGGSPVSPNTGQLTTVGALGVNATDLAGFDIASGTNAAFAALTLANATAPQLFTLNLNTGAVTSLGAIGGGQAIRDLALPVRTENIYALVCDSNALLRFNAGAPSTILNTIQITGLAAGSEKIVAIDFRPASGQLYGISNASRIYAINTSTGVAMAIGSAAFTPALSGTTFGLDFNPAVDRIRLISNSGQNLRLHPVTGAVAATDSNLAYAADDANAGQTPNVASAAYSNNFPGTSLTTLYGIDSTRNTLVRQGSLNSSPVSPNTGQLFTVGALGVDPADAVGFDISSTSGAAFATFSVGTSAPQLYAVNTMTGAATLIGAIGSAQSVCDIAIESIPAVVFGVTANNTLVSFNAGTPGVINSSVSISGLASGETITGLDVRPATGELLALSSGGRIYQINTTSGQTTAISAAPLNPAVNGEVVSFDFNPTVDRIRLVTNTGQNLRLNPITGGVAATDTNLAFAAGDANAGAAANVAAVAYTNSFLGSTSTTLYGINGNGSLVTIGSVNSNPTSPNSGQMFTVGSLGVTVAGQAGFDIAPGSNAAYVTLTPASGASQLYSINLVSGAATLIGALGVSDAVRVLAVSNPNSVTQASAFTLCLRDDDTGDNLQVNFCTGDYQFTRCGAGGVTLTGRGAIGRSNGVITLRDSRVRATFDTNFLGRNTGEATIKPSLFGPTFTIEDNGGNGGACGCR